MENVLIVVGRESRDHNFITVYADGAIYTMARGCADWGVRRIGDTAACGGIVTADVYNTLASRASGIGVYALYSDGRWERID